jgi:hypothetical protein
MKQLEKITEQLNVTEQLNEIYKAVIEEIDIEHITQHTTSNNDGSYTLYEYDGPLFNVRMALIFDIASGGYGIHTSSNCGSNNITTYKFVKAQQQNINERVAEYHI